LPTVTPTPPPANVFPALLVRKSPTFCSPSRVLLSFPPLIPRSLFISSPQGTGSPCFPLPVLPLAVFSLIYSLFFFFLSTGFIRTHPVFSRFPGFLQHLSTDLVLVTHPAVVILYFFRLRWLLILSFLSPLSLDLPT